jgi:hypothetical protein
VRVRSVLLISRRYGPQPRLPGRSGREHHDPANDYAIGDDILMVLKAPAGLFERQLGHSRCQTLAKASMAASRVAS